MLILQGNLIIMINPHVSLSFLRANVKRERGQKSRDTIFMCVTWNDKMDSFPAAMLQQVQKWSSQQILLETEDIVLTCSLVKTVLRMS